MAKIEKTLIFGLVLLLLLVVIAFLSFKLYQSNQALKQPIPKQTTVSGQITLPANLTASGGDAPSEVRLLLTIPENSLSNSSFKSDISQYLTILLTGLFTLLGTGIVLVYNFAASRSTRKFEWAKHLWDKYQDSYLDLRNSIKSTLDANVVQRKYDALRDKIYFPPNIERLLSELLDFLRSSETAQAKQQKANTFLKEFDDFIAQPWKYL